jgi:zinc-finger of transposase IS204/IS1001/IS1096/IS1165
MDLAVLLPQLAALVILCWRVGPAALEIDVASRGSGASGPACQVSSTSVHSHYTRTVADLPIGSRSVTRAVQVRRFRCRNTLCTRHTRHTFAEEFVPHVRRYGRQTTLLLALLDDLGVTVGGRPGARFAHRHFLLTSRTTLVRLVRRRVLPPLANRAWRRRFCRATPSPRWHAGGRFGATPTARLVAGAEGRPVCRVVAGADAPARGDLS